MGSEESTEMLELSAVVVGYNSSDHIGSMIQALEHSLSGMAAEVIVVDNASSDHTFRVAESALIRGRALRLDENVGYGRGANAGIALARGRLCLILNDDVVIGPESLRMMIGVFDASPETRLVAPRMVDPGGRTLPTARRHLPGIRDEAARVRDLLTRSRDRLIQPSGGPPMQVDFALAACLLGESDYLRSIGGFSNAYFMYGEDIDLCRRIKSLGGKVMLVPEAQARHDQAVAEDRRIRGRDFSRRILDARDTFYRTWLPRWERMLINLFRAFGPSDQPFRLGYHLPKVIYDGPSLRSYRRPSPLGDSSP
jgi:GT2 family glycosyltransferase